MAPNDDLRIASAIIQPATRYSIIILFALSSSTHVVDLGCRH